MFSEEDKERLIEFHEGSRRDIAGVAASAGNAEGLAEVDAAITKEDAEVLRALIHPRRTTNPPRGASTVCWAL